MWLIWESWILRIIGDVEVLDESMSADVVVAVPCQILLMMIQNAVLPNVPQDIFNRPAA